MEPNREDQRKIATLWDLFKDGESEAALQILRGINDLSLRDGYGQTLPNLALRFECMPAIQYLFEDKRLEIDLRNAAGNTPLMAAVIRNNLEMVKYLRGVGADVNARNEYGDTPLSYAIEEAAADVNEYLISEGADTHYVHPEGYNMSELSEIECRPGEEILGAGPFSKSAKESKYLWVVDRDGLKTVRADTPFPNSLRKEQRVTHTNLTGGGGAYAGGEVWFLDKHAVRVNACSRAYGYVPGPDALTEYVYQKMIHLWEVSGYKVEVVPLGKR